MNNPGSHHFRVTSTRDIYVGYVVALRIDDVVMPDGKEGQREVFEQFGAVAVVALGDDNTLTLVHQYRHPMGRRLWELPAGRLDIPGEDPLAAAQRELVEEVGLVAQRWDTLVDTAVSPGLTDEVIRIYLARDLSEVDREVLGGEEMDMTIRRVPLEQAVQLVATGEIINGLAVSGILAVQAVLSGAAVPRPEDAPWPDQPTRLINRHQQ